MPAFPCALVLLNETFYALIPECFDSWRSRRRNGKERGRRRNGGNSPLLQSPQPVGLKETWRTAGQLPTPPGTGESWDTWAKRRLSLSNPKAYCSVAFRCSRTHPRLPASTQQASVNGVCTDAESQQVTPAALCAPITPPPALHIFL